MGKHKRSRSLSTSSSEEEYYIKHKIRKLKQKLESRSRRSLSRSRRRSKKRRSSNSASSSESSRSQSRTPEPEPTNQSGKNDINFVECSSVINEHVTDPLQTGLDERVLQAMGANRNKKASIGEPLHEILAIHCQDILKSGLPEDQYHEIMAKYIVPENCKMILPPQLNPEIKAAINEPGRKRDERLVGRQKEVGVALMAVGKAESILLKIEDKDETTLSLIEHLSDASSILSKIHHTDSIYRRSSILSLSLNQNSLQPCFKDALLDAPLDSLLFGEDLTDRLKNAKVLGRSVADLKAGPSKPKPFQARDLNSSGPLRTKRFKRRSGQDNQFQGHRTYKRGDQRKDRGEQRKYTSKRTNKY